MTTEWSMADVPDSLDTNLIIKHRLWIKAPLSGRMQRERSG